MGANREEDGGESTEKLVKKALEGIVRGIVSYRGADWINHGPSPCADARGMRSAKGSSCVCFVSFLSSRVL